MSYKLLVLTVTLLASAHSYTDITMLNCPAQFNIAAYNTTSDSTAANLAPSSMRAFSRSPPKPEWSKSSPPATTSN